MNDTRHKGVKVDYRQMLIFGVLALAVVYHFSRPTLEKWFGTELPSITQNDEQDTKADDSNPNGYNYDAKLPAASSGKAGSTSPTTSSGSASLEDYGQSARSWLTEVGKSKYKSPAGLFYTGNRLDHVLLHCKDDPSKPTHGIFVGNGVEVVKMVDDAYEMVKTKSSKVDTQRSGDKMTHTVSMGRVVGHTGGQKLKRGRKELKRIKLVLAENRVITAFPTN